MVRAAIVLGVLVLLAGEAHAAADKVAVLPAQLEESAAGQVPALFDDYLLTAVQNNSDMEVIGQADIAAMLGFEQQKDLVGCDDMTCIADIGGALGVDKIIVVKIARLGEDWVVTAKLINIREARVESRTSDFIHGEVKALLQSVPGVVSKLFTDTATAAVAPPPGSRHDAPPVAEPASPAPAPEAAAATAPAPAAPPAAAVTAPVYDPSFGRGARIAGMILHITGDVFAAGSVVMFAALYPSADEHLLGAGIGNVFLGGLGLALSGAGSGLYLNGKARASTRDGEADGHSAWTWVGWGTAMAGIAGPLVIYGIDADPELGFLTGLVGVGGSVVSFAVAMANGWAETSTGEHMPMATIVPLRDGPRVRPGLGLAFEL